jgi:hypothetical protein
MTQPPSLANAVALTQSRTWDLKAGVNPWVPIGLSVEGSCNQLRIALRIVASGFTVQESIGAIVCLES